MQKNILLLVSLLASSIWAYSQSGVVVTGASSSGTGGSVTSSVGQLVYRELAGTGGTATTGNQTVTYSSSNAINGMYTGNGNGGFGGPVGGSSLQITDNGTAMTWTFTKGAGNFNDVMVIYLDTPGGFVGRTSTAEINDVGDVGRRAISNAGGGALTFPTGFGASHAISVETGYIGLWTIPASEQVAGTITNLPIPTNLGGGFANTSTTFSFTLNWADIGLSSSSSFDFIITYGNGDANSGTAMFSSDEAYGNGVSAGNPGTGSFSITSSQKYVGSTALFMTTSSATVWSAGSSWNFGKIPGSTNPVAILHDIAMDTDVTLNNNPNNSVSYINGAALTVQPGVVLTVNSFLLVGNSAGTELIFDSDNTGSAQLINNNTTAIQGGDVTTYRYIPAATNNRKAYRFVSSPVSSTGTVYDNWQLGGLTTSGFGTHITGSTTGANGFDATISGNPSMLEFRVISPTERNWAFVSSTNVDGLVPGDARAIYVRGDRNFDLSTNGNPNADTKLPLKGTLNQNASVTFFVNDAPGGFDFVGNPYQATINMSLVNKNNINPNFIYIWDANAASLGAYETVDVSAGSTDPNRFIEPGQSFFVVNDPAGGTASIEFTAASKAASSTGSGPFSISNARPSINVQLWKNDSNPVRFDTAIFNFDGDNAVNNMDAPEIGNFEENLSINKNGTLLSIENRAMPVDNEIILFDFSNVSNTNYELKITKENLALNLNAILVDSFSNNEVLLNDGLTNIPFTVDLNDPNSYLNDRFSIRFDDVTLSNDREELVNFNIVPNPATDVVTIQLGDEQDDAEVTFYNLLGQQIATMRTDGRTNNLDISNLSAGVYLVKINSGNHEKSVKLIKK